MPKYLDKILFLYPRLSNFEALFASKALPPFCDEVIRFLSRLSHELFQSNATKAHPDVVTFAFWCRKTSLVKMKAEHVSDGLRLGRGIVFHITPSNVPVNFAYSLAAGLLAGNANIVRVPTKRYPQVENICAAIRDLLEDPEFKALANHVALVRYDRDRELTAYLSRNADIRIIWGGDATINEIRQAPLPPRSFDLTFADRYSLCVINADEYLVSRDHVQIAQGFYNDTYLFDQNACTAPHLVVWLGATDNVRIAKEKFWLALHTYVKERYDLMPIWAVDKYTAVCDLAIREVGIQLARMPDNLIVRVAINSIPHDVEEYRNKAGYFLEYTARSLDEIVEPITRKFQTLAYFGINANILRDFVVKHRLPGIDRIVPIGRTSEFSLVWDGADLISAMSRICSIV
jgi:hypothetical protein